MKMSDIVLEINRLSYLAEFIKKNKNEDLKFLEEETKKELLKCCLSLEEEIKKIKE